LLSFAVAAQEVQLRVPVLQQHAALLGGPNASTCPICHKLFLRGDALVEHLKLAHKEHSAACKLLRIVHGGNPGRMSSFCGGGGGLNPGGG